MARNVKRRLKTKFKVALFFIILFVIILLTRCSFRDKKEEEIKK